MSVTVTDKAILEIKRVMQDQNISTDENMLEVGVSGGGCSGFQYKLGFKKKSEIDQLNSTVFNFDGFEAVVDSRSLMYLDGVTVDFHEDLDKRGFTFNNPQASGGCGCGKSFNV